jgi:glutaminase
MEMNVSNVSQNVDATNHPEVYRLFWAQDDDGDGLVRTSDLLRVLERNGLTRKNPQLGDLFSALDELETEAFDFPAFLRIIQSASALIEQVLQGNLALPDFAQFSQELTRQYTEVALNEEGQQATYIPPLAEVDPNQFALSVVSVDGQLLELGDSETDFSVQSACKPFNYCFALDDLGADTVHQHIGMEPSGQAFNARVLMSDGTGRPHNPMINAGAIMAAALIKSDRPLHRRLDYVRNMWAKMTGGSIPRFNAWMAQEESRTGDNNRALGYMMKAAGVLPHGEDAVDHELRDALELYFSVCALEINARELATAAATLANNGVCPVTQERVFEESTVRNCLTLMQMCGMYDGSGEFSIHIGLPAKSGVGGAVILVVPRLMGICIWSPRLDPIGNSARGVDMAKRLAQTYRLHVYDGSAERGDRTDPRVPAARLRARQTSRALRAASIGDLRTLQHLFDDQADLSRGDYDSRTPMHLAAAEGHLEVVRFLLAKNMGANRRDRWGGTPLSDAELGGYSDLSNLLKEHGANRGESQHLASESKATEEATQYGDTDAVVELLWAASENDIDGLRRCLAHGIPVSAADYDGRTALHLAASNGQIDAVKYLLAHDHPIHVRDRWNATPLDDARREHRDAVVELLSIAEREFHTLTIDVDLKEIARTSAFVKRYTAAHDINALVTHRINVVLDEVLASIIEHGSGDMECRQIALEFDVTPERLEIVVTNDGREFDPLAPSAPDLEDAEMSGMGIKLIRNLTEDVGYRRSNDKNVLTLAFRVAESSAAAA